MQPTYTYTPTYLEQNGKPWFPVMGEIHYSRYQPDLWEESLRKMKAGGLTIVSCYIIWIHHEEEEGVFDFSGCRDLHRFLSLCQEVGVKVILRPGPWVHGEVRNGGFPDWLVEKEKRGVTLRSNDPDYLFYVTRFWKKVFEQVSGFLLKDGGPVIGIQLENEYGHVGGLNGEEGEAHMRYLQKLAKRLGFDVPLYTATGWGGACIGDAIPVMGGYCEAPWDQSLTELAPNSNFVFSHIRNDALIACDHHVENAVTFDESRFPYLTAELGGGLQVTSHRRPVARGRDLGAMSISKLGSGVAMLGYYMYHGGSNPVGKLSTLQESRATGYANDLPEINYDFNAPIRQYGTISDSYKELRLLALFLQDFGEDFAPMQADLMPDHVKPDDFHTLRLSFRHNASYGYLFFNNYQRRYHMDAHPGTLLKVSCNGEEIAFPAVDFADGDYGFFPCRMPLGDAVLRTALATPLCRLNTAGKTVFVFYGDRGPQFTWESSKTADILHLSRRQALNACKLHLDQDYLILSDDFVWEENGKIKVTGDAVTQISCFPEPPAESLPGFVKTGQDGRFSIWTREVAGADIAADTVATAEASADSVAVIPGARRYTIHISYPHDLAGALSPERTTGRLADIPKIRQDGHDIILTIRYTGERMNLFCNGEKINDHFYTGQEVPISLGYFGFPETLTLEILPLKPDTPVFLETWPEIDGDEICRLDGISVQESFR